MSVFAVAVFGAASFFASHQATFWQLCWVILVCFFIDIILDTIDYYIGKFTTDIAKHFRWFKERFSESEMQKRQEQIEKYGAGAILLSRYILGVRTVTSYVAGMMNYPVGKYTMINVVANAVIFSLAAVLGYFLGGIPFVQAHFTGVMITFLFIFCIPVVIWGVRNYLKKRSDNKE